MIVKQCTYVRPSTKRVIAIDVGDEENDSFLLERYGWESFNLSKKIPIYLYFPILNLCSGENAKNDAFDVSDSEMRSKPYNPVSDYFISLHRIPVPLEYLWKLQLQSQIKLARSNMVDRILLVK